ncbi:ABC transporter ATP-binding protein [Starkeya sp. ORNL1]|uniref:ABC transporter ATP-binding protein n=1 Tax=Starkeya sp. ORNL1 TaxID=2709380 RepID=UPI00146484D9|nr:ABC transporter ATP-binding protein [Starkeya sp. ORNL1]QJP17358.1 ABC transporter ATP-binding protein [Starkeya sp. ORNL1]
MSVEIEHLSMRYGANPVVDDLTASFSANAISVLLGPSGCGKTTTLRCIAGLEEPSMGTIRIGDSPVFSRDRQIHLPPEKRDLGMVFQSYAIWPHMTVFENVALPLRARGIDAAETRKRVEETLAMVGLASVRDRSATQLSGGQQQRVAIARCIVSRPKLMLLDEPLSNLDAKLRTEMRQELKEMQRRTGLTMLFVTHDQEEAMSLADTIFLFRNGKIVQQGAPQDIYRRPYNRYVAEFLGKTNLFPVQVHAAGVGIDLRTQEGQFVLSRSTNPAWNEYDGAYVGVIRPEAWALVPDSQAGLPGQVEAMMFLGDRVELTVDSPVGRLLVLRPGYERFTIGDNLRLGVDFERIHLLRPEAAAA